MAHVPETAPPGPVRSWLGDHVVFAALIAIAMGSLAGISVLVTLDRALGDPVDWLMVAAVPVLMFGIVGWITFRNRRTASHRAD
jgi:hypothetical protein